MRSQAARTGSGCMRSTPGSPTTSAELEILLPHNRSGRKVAIPIRKGDDTATLLAAVNDALKEMSEDGTLTALSEKYFGTDISKE